MTNLTLIIRERYDLNDVNLQKQLALHGFVTTSKLETVGAIIGEAREENIQAIEELDAVAWIERQ